MREKRIALWREALSAHIVDDAAKSDGAERRCEPEPAPQAALEGGGELGGGGAVGEREEPREEVADEQRCEVLPGADKDARADEALEIDQVLSSADVLPLLHAEGDHRYLVRNR